MRPFTTILGEILANRSNISEFCDGELVALPRTGELLEKHLCPSVALQIARLQTLIVQEREKGHSFNQTVAMAEVTGTTLLSSMGRSLALQEDSACRIKMLERLIVEIVRENVPAENEHFGALYSLGIDMLVCRVPVPRQRFED